MRYKKLKIFIAIALIIFILVVANIIGFGFLQDKVSQSNLAIPIDIRKNSSIIQDNSSNQASVDQNQQSSATDQSQTQTTSVSPDNPQTTVPHPNIRTRAS